MYDNGNERNKKNGVHYEVCMGVAAFFSFILMVFGVIGLIVMFIDLIAGNPIEYNFWEMLLVCLLSLFTGIGFLSDKIS